jgi:hypothetical protein
MYFLLSRFRLRTHWQCNTERNIWQVDWVVLSLNMKITDWLHTGPTHGIGNVLCTALFGASNSQSHVSSSPFTEVRTLLPCVLVSVSPSFIIN